MKFGIAKDNVGPPCGAKFYANRWTGVGIRPPKIENFHFLVKVAAQERNLLHISTTVRGFYAPNYTALMFWIWRDSLHRLRNYCRETSHHIYPATFTPEFFRALCRKTMHWIEKWLTTNNGRDVLYHHAKSGRDPTTRAFCRCEKVVFVRLFVTLRGRRAVRSMGQELRRRLWVDFHWIFRRFFPKDLRFQTLPITIARRCHNFRQIVVEWVRLASPKMARNEQVCTHQMSYRK